MTPLRLDYNSPRYAAYGIYHAHTNELISIHETRRDAEAHVTDWAHRVRGVTSVGPPE